MAFVQWDENFVTGVEPLDDHHRHLVALLNRTYDDFICGAPDERIGGVLEELIRYTDYHFSAEELWMRENDYAKLDEHKEEHMLFSQKIESFYNEFTAGNAALSLDVLTFLKRWLNNHILGSDAEYSVRSSSGG